MEAIFKMPFTSQALEVDFDESVTGDDVIECLKESGYLREGEYGLKIDGGNRVQHDQTLVSAGAHDGCIIDVIVKCRE